MNEFTKEELNQLRDGLAGWMELSGVGNNAPWLNILINKVQSIIDNYSSHEKYINEMMRRHERTSLLLGEITGSLSILVTKSDGNMYCDAIKHDIKNLFGLVMSRVNSIYYDVKNE